MRLVDAVVIIRYNEVFGKQGGRLRIDTRRAAELLGVGMRAVQQRVATGTLPVAQRVGRVFLLDLIDVLSLARTAEELGRMMEALSDEERAAVEAEAARGRVPTPPRGSGERSAGEVVWLRYGMHGRRAAVILVRTRTGRYRVRKLLERGSPAQLGPASYVSAGQLLAGDVPADLRIEILDALEGIEGGGEDG